MKKSKWKYLRDSLLWNLLYLISTWMIIDTVFILKEDMFAFGIAFLSWLYISTIDAHIDILKDELKDLNDKLS